MGGAVSSCARAGSLWGYDVVLNELEEETQLEAQPLQKFSWASSVDVPRFTARGRQFASASRSRWHRTPVVVSSLLAVTAATVWIGPWGADRLAAWQPNVITVPHPRQHAAVGAAESKAAVSPTFVVGEYGATDCPSGTTVIASRDQCKDYAAGNLDQGICARVNGYGADCDGPPDFRKDWCQYRPNNCWQSKNHCVYFKDSGDNTPQLDVRPVCVQVMPRATTPATNVLPSVAPRATSSCSMPEENTDFKTGIPFDAVYGINDPDACQTRCEGDSKCGAWTWGKIRGVPGLSDVCFLKGLEEGLMLRRGARHGVVSGIPCQARQRAMRRSLSKPVASPSLLCFSLMAATYEKLLLIYQRQERMGLFACNEWIVYSEKQEEIDDGVVTTPINVNTTCNMGGPYWTCLNSWIFIEVWRHLVEAGHWRAHGWTLKLDPDAVFIPDRARLMLQAVADPTVGVYVMNCKQGDQFSFHGPLEVLSRNAVDTYARGWKKCTQGKDRLHFGLWGEDLFLDQCLTLLGVSRHNDGHYLSEPHCDAPGTNNTYKGDGNTAWKSCDHDRYAAFHPFKDDQQFRQCAQRAAGIATQNNSFALN